MSGLGRVWRWLSDAERRERRERERRERVALRAQAERDYQRLRRLVDQIEVQHLARRRQAHEHEGER